MKLDKIFAFVSDSCKVQVISYSSGKILAEYDGKNSIPVKYNNCELLEICVNNNTLELYV